MAEAAAALPPPPPAGVLFLFSTKDPFRASLFLFILLVHKFYSIVNFLHILLILDVFHQFQLPFYFFKFSLPIYIFYSKYFHFTFINFSVSCFN